MSTGLNELKQGIRERRTELGWSLGELSRRSGYVRSYLSLIENGKRGCSIESLTDIYEAMGWCIDAGIKRLEK